MKYHGHIIKVVKQDLGYSDGEDNLNKTYEIHKGEEVLAVCWSLNNAKEYIDSGYDKQVLC